MRRRWTVAVVLAALVAGPTTAPAQTVPEEPRPSPPWFWFQADFQAFVINKGALNTPLVTTTSNTDPTQNSAGQLGDPNTSVLYGNNGVSNHALTGFRLGGGVNLTDPYLGEPWTFEWNYFFTEQASTNFSQNSDANGNPALSRPFFGTGPLTLGTTNRNIVEQISFPGVVTGGIQVTSQSRLWGTEELLTLNLYQCGCLKVDALFGFRYLQFDETLIIDTTSTAAPPANGLQFFLAYAGAPVFQTDAVEKVRDDFHTSNRFLGGELGGRASLFSSDLFTGLSFSATAKVALGETDRVVQNSGLTSVTSASATFAPTTAGVLVVPSNSTRSWTSRFTAIPEGVLTLSYELNTWAQLSLSYSALYWPSIIRPGKLVNATVNNQQIPSDVDFNASVRGTDPTLNLKDSSLWVQGFTAGLIFSY